MTLLG